MEIRIITVGKIKEKYLSDGIAEYAKRLGRYCKLNFCQVADEKTPDKASDALNMQIKDTEGERLMKHIREQDYVIALAIDGKMLDSVELSQKIEKLGVSGVSSIRNIILIPLLILILQLTKEIQRDNPCHSLTILLMDHDMLTILYRIHFRIITSGKA